MKSMKMDKKQMEKNSGIATIDENPGYPYGLKLSLDNESIWIRC